MAECHWCGEDVDFDSDSPIRVSVEDVNSGESDELVFHYRCWDAQRVYVYDSDGRSYTFP